jgi:hypothetical protein
MKRPASILFIGLMILLFIAATISSAAETLPSKAKVKSPARSKAVATPPPPPGPNNQQVVPGVQQQLPKHPIHKHLPGKIYFKSPKQGDHFTQGDSITLRWDKLGHVEADCFQLYLFKGISMVGTITNQWGHPNFQWTVPSNQVGSNFKIRLRTCDNQFHADSAVFPIISATPDLSIGKHSVVPVKNIPGGDRDIKFKARIDNIGSAQSVAITARVEFHPPGAGQMVQRDIAIPAMPFGGHRYINEAISLNQHGQWNYTLQLIVPDQPNNDPNTSNNQKSGSYAVGSYADLNLLSIFKDPSGSRPINRKVHISGPVRNDGNVAAQNFKITISCTKCNMGLASGSSHVEKSETITNLMPGATHWFKIGFSWPCAGDMTCHARADSENVVQEFKENNNSKSIGVKVVVF